MTLVINNSKKLKLRFCAHLVQFFLLILDMVSKSHRMHLNPLYDQKRVRISLRNLEKNCKCVGVQNHQLKASYHYPTYFCDGSKYFFSRIQKWNQTVRNIKKCFSFIIQKKSFKIEPINNSIEKNFTKSLTIISTEKSCSTFTSRSWPEVWRYFIFMASSWAPLAVIILWR